MDFKPKCLATGIGSMPHTDIQKVLGLILENMPQIPFWPQLPKLSPREAMVPQFIEGLPGLVLKGKDVNLEPSADRDKLLEAFYEKVIAKDLGYFAVSRDFATGLYAFLEKLQSNKADIEFVKGQITGPFTFSASTSTAFTRMHPGSG